MALLIDETAKGIAINRWSLPECLHVPIATVDEDAIRNYVGDIDRVVSGRGFRKAFLVTVPASAAIDPLLPISDHGATVEVRERSATHQNVTFSDGPARLQEGR
jgi:hypothetical protein